MKLHQAAALAGPARSSRASKLNRSASAIALASVLGLAGLANGVIAPSTASASDECGDANANGPAQDVFICPAGVYPWIEYTDTNGPLTLFLENAVTVGGISIVGDAGEHLTIATLDTLPGLGDLTSVNLFGAGIDVFGQGPGITIDLTSTDVGEDSATLVSGLAGINAVNTSGSVSIRMTEGSVVGTSFAGVNAQGAGLVSVQLLGGTTVSGQTAGLLATSTGGDVVVTTTGLVSSSAGVGVSLNAVGDVTADIGDVDAAGVGLQATAGGDANVRVSGDIFGDTAVRVQALAGDVRFSLLDGASVESTNAAFYGVGLLASGPGNVFAVIDGNIANGGLNAVAGSGGVALTGAGDILNTLGVNAVDVATDAGAAFVGLDGDIVGSDRGINVSTSSGDIIAAVGGTVSGGFRGVSLQSSTGDLLVDIGAGGAVSSGGHGVFVQSDGQVGVRVAGSVVGARGIEALGGGAGDVVIDILEGGSVGTAGQFTSEGVFAAAFGTGDVNVRVEGAVNGGGLRAYSTGSGDVTVTGSTTGVVVNTLANRAGISASAGAGDVVVDFAGSVTALDQAISTFTDTGALGIRTGGALVSGTSAVVAESVTGDITILSGGTIDAAVDGIRASTTGDIVLANDAEIRVSGQGVHALGFGSGDVTILGSGDIAGSAQVGILAMAGGDVVIEYAGDIGSEGDRVEFAGISAVTDAVAGTLSINMQGDVWSDFVGIDAVSIETAAVAVEIGASSQIVAAGAAVETSSNGGEATVTARSGSSLVGNEDGGAFVVDMANTGAGSNVLNVEAGALVRSVDGLSSGFDDNVIRMSGGAAGVNNAGRINGAIDFANASSSVFNNTGFGANGWRTAGLSTFSAGDDVLNNTGFIVTNADSLATTLNFGAGDDAFVNSGALFVGEGAPGAAVLTVAGLETWTNEGLILLADGAADDRVRTDADTTFGANSLLAVDIGGAAAADLFDTSGSLAIEQGARLVLNASQPFVLYSQYVVAEADGGVTGEFDFADQFLTAFAGLRDGYTATTAFVEFAQLRALAEAGLTPNQKETAAGADSLADGNVLKDALILLPDDETARDAFDQLSGEIHPSARTAAVEASRLPRDAVLDRLSADGEGSSAWGRAWGSRGESDGDRNAARMDREVSGFVVGLDRTIGDTLTFGVAASTSTTDITIDRRHSEGSVETIEGLAYAGARFGEWRVRGGVGYGVTSTETRRSIAFPGFAASATGDYEGALLQGFVEAGYRFAASGGHAEPFANVTAIQVRSDAFSEHGGDGAALAGEAAREDLIITTMGLRIETNTMGPLSLGGSTGWHHTSGDIDPAGWHAFAGGAPFTILGAARSEDAAFARVEARWRLSPSMSAGLAYDGTLGSGGADHAITGGFKVDF